MVTTWNGAGEATGTTSRTVGLVAAPALSALVLVLFALLPRIDPLGENVRRFRRQYDTFVALFVGFLVYLHLLVLAWNAGYRFQMIQALAPAVGVLFYYVGVVVEHAEQNWFVGVRTPWTLSNEKVWKRTHERVGPLFKLAGLVAALGALAPAYAEFLIAAPAAAIALYSFVFSYVEYRRVTA